MTTAATSTNDQRYVALNLRLARVSRRMTQHQLARAAGVNDTLVSMIENGLRPPMPTLAKLAAALDVRPEDLLRRPSDDPLIAAGAFATR